MWFVLYSFLFPDPITAIAATLIHQMWEDDEPSKKNGSVEVPNVISTPGDFGDYDA